MLKALFVGIWVAGLLSGSVYLFSTSPSGENEKTAVEKVSDYFGGLESVNLGGLNVTIPWVARARSSEPNDSPDPHRARKERVEAYMKDPKESRR